MGPFPHDAPKSVISDENPAGTDGFEGIADRKLAKDDQKTFMALSGEMPTHRDLKRVEAYLKDESAISDVNFENVTLQSRTQGVQGYRVRPGYSLSRSPYNLYGDGNLHSVSQDANPKLKTNPTLNVGDALEIPAVD